MGIVQVGSLVGLYVAQCVYTLSLEEEGERRTCSVRHSITEKKGARTAEPDQRDTMELCRVDERKRAGKKWAVFLHRVLFFLD